MMMMMMIIIIIIIIMCTEETKIISLAKFSIGHQQGNIADLIRNIIKVRRD
jgi:hypothetical protein